MIALGVVTALGLLVLAAYASEKIRNLELTTARQRKHPRAARVGCLLGMVAAWIVQAGAIAAIYLLMVR